MIKTIRQTWNNHIRTQNWPVIAALILITALLCFPVYNVRINRPVDGDYGPHIGFAMQFLKTGELDPMIASHPALHLLLAFLYWLTRSRLDLYTAQVIIQVITQIAIALILYLWIGAGGAAVSGKKHWDWLRAAAAVSFTFLAPVVIPALLDHKLYYGYIGMSNYHNPTVHLLKPFALLSFLFAIRSLEGKKSGWVAVLFSALLVSVSSWIKPSYVLAVLPGLGLASLIHLAQKRDLDWRMIWLGFALPGVLSLGAQWFIAYYFSFPDANIIWAPFKMESGYSNWLLLKFLLSALFPLLCLWMARRSLLKDSALLAGWAVFLAGVAQNYLLAEGGERFYHGNFRWSGQIVLFLLFAVTLRWLLREKILPNRALLWEKITSLGAYGAHLAGGAAYYVYCLFSQHYW